VFPIRAKTAQLLRGRAIAAGGLTEADFDELERYYQDPTFWFVAGTDFGAWGRRPGSRHQERPFLLSPAAGEKCLPCSRRALR